MKSYDLKVMWYVYHKNRLPHNKHDFEVTQIIEFPKWLNIEPNDIDDDGNFYNIDKLKRLNKEIHANIYNVVSAQLVPDDWVEKELAAIDNLSDS